MARAGRVELELGGGKAGGVMVVVVWGEDAEPPARISPRAHQPALNFLSAEERLVHAFSPTDWGGGKN